MTTTNTNPLRSDELVASYWTEVESVLQRRKGATLEAAKRAVDLFRKRTAALGVGDIQYHAPPRQTANDISLGGYLTAELQSSNRDALALTPLASIALIARVTRRILPLTAQLQPRLTTDHQSSLLKAIEAIERITETNLVDKRDEDVSRLAGLAWVAAEGRVKPLARIITDAIREVLQSAPLEPRQTAKRSPEYEGDVQEHLPRVATEALDAARSILQEMQHDAGDSVRPADKISQGLNRDLGRAILLSQFEKDSVTPRRITLAMFGPLWPDGPPEGWPADPTPAAVEVTPEPPPPQKKGKGKK